MSRGRSTLLWLAVALGLGAYIYFVEMKREPSDTEPPKDRVFAGLEAGTISTMTLRASNGNETTVERDGAGWRITAPITARADGAEVSSVASNLTSLDISRVVDDAPADLATFGLAEPRLSVAFTTENATQTLLLGDRTATGGDLYASIEGQSRVFLIPSWLESSLDRTTFQLRDKAIASLDRAAVDTISIIGTPGTIELRRNGDRWRMQQPIAVRADAGAVDTLLSRLTSGEMQAIVAEDPATLDVYGLAPPRTAVTLSGSGERLAQVLIGSESGETAVHAKDDARSMVFTVDATLASDLQRPASAYRSKALFDVETTSASQITVTRDETTLTFERAAPADDATATPTWRQTSPEGEMAADRIAELASRLQTLRADSWEVRVPRGATPVATIAVQADGVTETVRLVRDGESVLALRDDEPGAARLALSTVDDLLRLLDDEDAS